MTIDEEKLSRLIERQLYQVEAFFNAESLEDSKAIPQAFLYKYNYGIGTLIQMKLLKPKSILYHAFTRAGIHDKDEMAMILIRSLHNSYPNDQN